MKRSSVKRKPIFVIAGWVMPFVALASFGCGTAPGPRNLDEFFSQSWMLKSNVIESEIKKILEQRCGKKPTQQCMKEVGFQECLKTQEGLECYYSEIVLVRHDSRAKVHRREETLNIDMEIKLDAGMTIDDAEVLIGRSGTNFIFR